MLVRAGLIVAGGGAAAAEPFEYAELARNLLSGHGYVYRHLGTDYRAFYSGVPYVAVAAALSRTFADGVLPLLLAQALFSALLALVVWRIARALAGDRVGLVAAALVALHPGLAYYDARKLHPLSLDALTIALATLLAIHMRRRATAGAAALAGVALALAIYQRPTAALMLPLFAGLAWLDRRPGRVPRLAVFASVTLLVLAPWLVRNQQIFGAPLLSTTAAESFWRGNAPHSLGSSYLPDGRTVLDTADPELRRAIGGADEQGQSRAFLDAALSTMRASPLAFVGSVVRKLVLFWSFGPQTGTLYSRTQVVLYVGYYVLVMALAALGAWSLRRRQGPPGRGIAASTLAAAVVSVWVVQSLFYVEIRHRWGVEPLVLVLSAAAIVLLRDRWRWEKLPGSGALPCPTNPGAGAR